MPQHRDQLMLMKQYCDSLELPPNLDEAATKRHKDLATASLHKCVRQCKLEGLKTASRVYFQLDFATEANFQGVPMAMCQMLSHLGWSQCHGAAPAGAMERALQDILDRDHR